MKLNYAALQDGNFGSAMRKLGSYPFKKQKTAYDVMKINNRIEQETKLAQDLYTKLLKQYAKLEADGSFVPRKDKDGVPQENTYEIPEDKQEAFGKAVEEFRALEFAVDWKKVTFEDLEECRLTAAEMDALQQILSEPAA